MPDEDPRRTRDNRILTAVSDYDVVATDLARLCDGLIAAPLHFDGLLPGQSHRLGAETLECVAPAWPGRARLRLFVNPMSRLRKLQSFICMIAAPDHGGRLLTLEGFAVSPDPRIGAYFYLQPDAAGLVERIIDIPPGAAHLRIGVRRLQVSDDDLVIEPRLQILPETLLTLQSRLARTRSRMLATLGSPVDDTAVSPAEPAPFLLAPPLGDDPTLTSAGGVPLGHTDAGQDPGQDLGQNADFLLVALQDGAPDESRDAMQAAMAAARDRGLAVALHDPGTTATADLVTDLVTDLGRDLATGTDVVLVPDAARAAAWQAAHPGFRIGLWPPVLRSDGCNPAGRPGFAARAPLAIAGGDPALRQAVQDLGGHLLPPPQQGSADRAGTDPANIAVRVLIETAVPAAGGQVPRPLVDALAAGTPVISLPSDAVTATFGDLVPILTPGADLAALVAPLTDDPLHWLTRSHLGYRRAMSLGSPADRIAGIRRILADGDSTDPPVPFVSILAPTRAPGDHLRLIRNLVDQSHPALEAVIGFGHLWSEAEAAALMERLAAEARAKGRVIHLRPLHFHEAVPLGYKLNAMTRAATGEIVAKMDDDDYYGPHYLADMLLPMRWGGHDIVGKRASFWHHADSGAFQLKFADAAHRTGDFIFGATFVARRSIFLREPFEERPRGSDTFMLTRLRSRGYRFYAADPFNFCVVRHGENHTWTPGAAFWQTDSQNLPEGFGFDRIGI